MNKDYNYYLNKVTRNKISLSRIPEEFKTPELCKVAVTKNSFSLVYVPEKLRTTELCNIAVSKNFTLLFHVPEKLKNLFRLKYLNYYTLKS